MEANKKQIETLDSAYTGRICYHGELHDHSNSGGTSDGKCTLTEWKENLKKLDMDFAAILDHRQVRHMYLPEWDSSVFVCGTEPGTHISDSRASVDSLHYNMLVPDPENLRKVLEAFPEFQYEGGIEGHFQYSPFTRDRFARLIDAVLENDGFFVVPHPKQIMQSEFDDDYWFHDYIGIEAFYMDKNSDSTKEDYPLWVRLLQSGKRLYACAGGDLHAVTTDGALTTIYAEPGDNISHAIVPVLRTGDFTCGSVGVRMLLGDTRMGGHTVFGGQTLTVAVGDFHRSAILPGHDYRMTVLAGETEVLSVPVSPSESTYVSLPVDDTAPYYRVEVWDATAGYRIALGNPIWNDIPPVS